MSHEILHFVLLPYEAVYLLTLISAFMAICLALPLLPALHKDPHDYIGPT